MSITPKPQENAAPDDARPADLVRTISEGGGIALRTLSGGELIAAALMRQPMANTAANALGRALMGAVLLAVAPGEQTDDDAGEVVQLQLRGDGPLRGIVAISDARGRVRGMVSQATADPRLSDGTPDVARAIGLGTLSVVRHREGRGQPYSGTVPLVSGEIAGDLTLYLTESEQTPSAVGLGVSLDVHSGAAALGFLVQQLPGANREEVALAERNVRALPPLSRLAAEGTDPEALMDRLLMNLGGRTRHREAPIFYCPCSSERARRSLQLLGRQELRQMMRDAVRQEVKCEFCGRAYYFEGDEIGSVLPDA